MDILEAIETRRSIRRFTEKSVSKDTINSILKAAMYAPSAENEQPWQFVVIDDKKKLQEIPKFHDYARMCLTAPAAILVCGDMTLLKAEDHWVSDLAAATQNLLLASHANNLGTVWVGVYFEKDYMDGFIKLLSLPEHIIPYALIPLGYSDEKKAKVERFRKDRIHFNSW